MIYDVYVDLFFLINFSMDYICLYISAKILKHKISASRFILSASLGGIYSVIALFININSILAFIIDSLVCLIMIAICFYEKNEKPKYIFASALLYVGISMLMGGIMTAIFNILNKLNLNFDDISDDGAYTYTFAIIAIISAALSIKGISLISKKNKHREYYINVTINGISREFLGFVDTGNLIKEQISGKSIIFIDKTAAEGFIDINAQEKFLNGEIIYKGSRLVPLTTASGSSLILIFSPDKVTAKEKTQKETPVFEVDCLISVSDISKNGDYGAIIPEDIIKHSF